MMDSDLDGVYCYVLHLFVFFKQKTAYEMRISDWSSDVCSSDLCRRDIAARRPRTARRAAPRPPAGAGYRRVPPLRRGRLPRAPPPPSWPQQALGGRDERGGQGPLLDRPERRSTPSLVTLRACFHTRCLPPPPAPSSPLFLRSPPTVTAETGPRWPR